MTNAAYVPVFEQRLGTNHLLAQQVEQASHLRRSQQRMNWLTFAALGLFVILGPQVGSAALDALRHGVRLDGHALTPLFILNIAIVLFAWRRGRYLQSQVQAAAFAEATYKVGYTDFVTGLPNRRFLVDRAGAGSLVGACLLLFDLDHFKKVNDLYGHSAGDDLLRAVAGSVRPILPEGATLARIGGDEFAILIRGQGADPEGADALAARILEALREPLGAGGKSAQVSASVGIARVTRPDTSFDDLLRHADLAMYEAKRVGRGRAVAFDEAMERAFVDRVTLESDLRAALAANQFVPYYQPLVSLNDGQLKGFEVLARWRHPRRGLLEPASFIPVAEVSGLIAELSMQVMRRAFLEARDWPQHLKLSVNVSAIQLTDPLLPQRFLHLLTETNFPAGRIEVEITESALLDNEELAIATVQSLKNMGASVSLDDFGTGYASLTQLRLLAVDRIKIDKSFVVDVMEDPQSQVLVKAIANLGQSMGLSITAEGVESADAKQTVLQFGCTDAQGWHFGRPVPAGEIEALLAPRVQDESSAPPRAAAG